MKVPVVEQLSVECKKSALHFLSQNHHQARHHSLDLRDVGPQDALCSVHHRRCKLQECDLFVAGPPCAPFSSQRAGRTQSSCPMMQLSVVCHFMHRHRCWGEELCSQPNLAAEAGCSIWTRLGTCFFESVMLISGERKKSATYVPCICFSHSHARVRVLWFARTASSLPSLVVCSCVLDGRWTIHAELPATTYTLRMIKQRRPRCGLLENVKGMAEEQFEGQKAPLVWVKQELEDAGFCCEEVMTNLLDWHEILRQRTSS